MSDAILGAPFFLQLASPVLLALLLLTFVLLSAIRLWRKQRSNLLRRSAWRIATRPVHQRSRRKPTWVRREIIRLKALSDQSCHKLAATFNRLHASRRGVTVGKTWVAEVVRAHRYEIAQLRTTYKRRIPIAMPMNAVWGLDFTGKMDDGGKIHSIVGLIDHGSRLALALRPLPDRTAITTLKVLLAAIETFGKPSSIRTDNDAVFTSRPFRFALRWLGIRHRLSTPGCPWQNGRVERLFGTLKKNLNRLVVPEFASLEIALAEFRFWYNCVRPHQHLCGWTPAEAWHGVDPYRVPPKLAYCFSAWDGLLEGVFMRR